MNLTEWEQNAVSELGTLYSDFFRKLSLYGRKCYLQDAVEILKKHNALQLTHEQKDNVFSYWSKYLDDFNSLYHQFYLNACGYFDVRFIPDDIFAGYIDGFFNNRTIEAGFSDKNYFDLILSGFKMPKTYLHLINGILLDESYKMINKRDAETLLYNLDQFIVKPSVASYGGLNVELYSHPTKIEIQRLLNSSNNNLIFQEYIKQSEITESLHKNSLNTIRIMTFVFRNSVKTLNPIMKMGLDNSIVDNASSGGIFCKINDDGSLDNVAYNIAGRKFQTHPNGCVFSGVRLPFMEKIKELVTHAAYRFPHFRLIGWDVGINYKNEPVIIEANLTMSSIDMVQLCWGPFFGEQTEEILDEVFFNKTNHQFTLDLTQYV